MPTSSNSATRRVCPVCGGIFRRLLTNCPSDGAALEPLVSDALVGKQLAGRYTIVHCIGEGGMGRVYLAKHDKLPRQFAIKVLFGDLAADEDMRARFRTEAALAARLNHPNIASIVDFGETREGLLFIVMEHVAGSSLSQVVAGGLLEPTRIVRIAQQIAAGLDHAHRRDLVHRDLKADNILLTRDGDDDVVKIVDFGIALSLDNNDRRLTQEGIVVGTPDIMSPEQLTGSEIDHRTDLFALGVVIYEMLAGVAPFDGTPMEVARQNLSASPPAILARSGRHVAPELEAVARKLMAKRPSDRYRDAKHVARALEHALATTLGQPTPPMAPFGSDELAVGFESTLHIAARRRRTKLWLGPLLLAGLVATATLLLVNRPQQNAAPQPKDQAHFPAPIDAGPKAAPSEPTEVHTIAVDAVDAADAADAAVDAAPSRRPRRKSARRAPPPITKEDIYESRY